jgi:5-bromo-4-chloroindolyl phosphate hydrolysis protein
MELLKKRLANLLCVKSIVTVILTGVFAYMTVNGSVSAEQFLTVFTVVIAFYFGTQSERKAAVEASTQNTNV